MPEDKIFDDEIDLKKLLNVIWQGKYFVIILSMISFAISSIYLRTLKPEYEVSLLLAPVQEEQTSPNFGNLGGLASLAGISLPTSNASDFSKFQIMLQTQEIATLVFRDKNLIRELFAAEWDINDKMFKEPKQNKIPSMKKYIEEVLTAQPPKKYIKPNPAKLTGLIRNSINISLDNKTKYLSLTAENSNPKLFSQLMVSMIKNTDELFKRKFVKQANDAVDFYQIKISKTRSQEHREILATLIAKEERKLLLATRDGPFVAEILTGPNISLNPTSPKTSLILALGILFGGFLSCVILFIKNFLSNRS